MNQLIAKRDLALAGGQIITDMDAPGVVAELTGRCTVSYLDRGKMKMVVSKSVYHIILIMMF